MENDLEKESVNRLIRNHEAHLKTEITRLEKRIKKLYEASAKFRHNLLNLKPEQPTDLDSMRPNYTSLRNIYGLD